MAGMVGSAVVQETVSRITSYLFSKCDHDERTASTGHHIERLEMAHTELELALERSARMPITDVSLLRRRKLLERAFKDCGDLLHRCIKQQTMDAIELEQPVRHSFSKWIAHVTQSSVSSYFTGFCKDNISCSDVRRNEWFAECANRFLRDVESGCSPLRCVFSNPLVRQLLEGKTLEYKMVQGSILRCLHIQSMCVEGRGVEATLEFRYEDRKTPMRSFSLKLMLRLSESTDIVGTAIRSLQSFMSSMKDVTEAAVRELTQLPLQDISHSHAASCFTIKDLCSYDTHLWRPDPLCCKPDGCPTSYIPSELSCKFPEQIILIHVVCYVSAFECSNLHNTTDGNSRNLMADLPPLKLGVGFAPHFFDGRTQGRTAVEIIGGKEEFINDMGSLQQMVETVQSKAIKHYICQPDLAYYKMAWYSGHGGACFMVQKSGTEIARARKVECDFETRGSSKRRRSK
ncbi:hypothetical protein SEVIR_8G228500v4 [Setaria viridis]|uniref:Uncharacterized protein n=1 Tax=Setaria viridis TaxID=4556 RepID=A0A4U6TLR1_SETVI|nr:uncharacterized protein LOC117833600 [Setaria viridis]XP_034569054.1 uncharacterized protein LOC117833600 [Setaria viridis]XP_034569055.1 uncharacterized protein LOC117833600 [Setaria viridis]TKW02174.1 hypothetical protein SEVIR_8G228500v2 [Setaria viridis]